MSQARRGAGTVLAGFAALGFSFKAILVKLAYPYGVDAITLLALRMLFSLPFFVVMAFLSGSRGGQRFSRHDILTLLVLGILGYYLASLLDFLGLQYISAGLERLILFLYPVLVVVLSALVLRTRVPRAMLIALPLSYAGIALAFVHDASMIASSRQLWLGSALVFGSAVSYALYLVINSRVVGRLGSARLTAYATTIACVACIAQFLLTRPLSALALPWQVYALSVAMALFTTVLPVYMVSESLRLIGASRVALISGLGPVMTIFLGWLLLDEALSSAQLAGAALVVAGVLLVNLPRRRPA